MLCVLPIHTLIENLALKTCHRLNKAGLWKHSGPSNLEQHLSIKNKLDISVYLDVVDSCPSYFNDSINFKIIINERANWKFGLHIINNPHCWYLDMYAYCWHRWKCPKKNMCPSPLSDPILRTNLFAKMCRL
jgi:hypothetical protein